MDRQATRLPRLRSRKLLVQDGQDTRHMVTRSRERFLSWRLPAGVTASSVLLPDGILVGGSIAWQKAAACQPSLGFFCSLGLNEVAPHAETRTHGFQDSSSS